MFPCWPWGKTPGCDLRLATLCEQAHGRNQRCQNGKQNAVRHDKPPEMEFLPNTENGRIVLPTAGRVNGKHFSTPEELSITTIMLGGPQGATVSTVSESVNCPSGLRVITSAIESFKGATKLPGQIESLSVLQGWL
jgi:hypothetical protein